MTEASGERIISSPHPRKRLLNTVFSVFAVTSVLVIAAFVGLVVSDDNAHKLPFFLLFGVGCVASLICLAAVFEDLSNLQLPPREQRRWQLALFALPWAAVPHYWAHYVRGAQARFESTQLPGHPEPRPRPSIRRKPGMSAVEKGVVAWLLGIPLLVIAAFAVFVLLLALGVID